ncbi:MAG: type IV pilus secretin PilQ [Acidobacteria bacterium]|nr:type IV pilus secretin PilQ [Acidobacteriota bacterium]MBU1475548.1 type IV pilus secretin PilQ [Acidobacteriota bacterium]
MNHPSRIRVLAVLLVLLTTVGKAGTDSDSVVVKKIDILPNSFKVSIVLETSEALSIQTAGYEESGGPTLFFDLLGVDTSSRPVIAQMKSASIKNIQLGPWDSGTARLKIDLNETVPFTYTPYKDRFVIDLFPIQRTQNRYILDPEMEKLFQQNEKTPLHLRNIRIQSLRDRVDCLVDLTGRVFPQIFVLGDPLRMVVDLHNTLHSGPVINRTIRNAGVSKVRSAQFERGNPYTITRLVFDLEKPTPFFIRTTENNLTVSFLSGPAPASLPEKEIEETKTIKDESGPPALKKTAVKTQEKTPTKIEPILTQSQTLQSSEEVYQGVLIDIRMRDMDIRDVIMSITQQFDLNVIFNPQVRGTVTVDLVAIPWDQALDLILKENNLGRTIEGNVLRIAPIDILTREQEAFRKLNESKEMAGPVITRTYELSYAQATQVEGLLRDKKSERGKITVYDRTNTLIITDVKERLDLMEELIRVFDKPTPQVSIHCRIVEATSNFVRNLGIQWGWRGQADPFYGNHTSLSFPNKILVDGAQIPQGQATRGIGGPLGGYAINLPAPSFSTAVGLSIGNVLDTFRIDLALSALETTGEGKIQSEPWVVTQDNKLAEIIQGRQIPLQTTANFTVTTRYQNAALELRATPQVSNDGNITMILDIQNNSADFANLVNGIPPLITQSANITVTVPDGGTTVIGGIYRTEDSITKDRVPFFHQIPILGNLFKSTARTRQNRELLIFITPRIIKK